MRDFLLGLAFALLGAVIVTIAKDFPTIGNLQFGASLFPMITGTGMLICGLLLAAKSFGPAMQTLRNHRQEGGLPRPDFARLARLALPCVLVIFYIYSSETIGAAPALCILMLALFRAGSVRWKVALPVSVVAAVAIYLIFTRMLIVPLPSGPLGF